LILLSLILSSCSTTYHAYVVAENPDLAYSSTQGFLYEKDSVKIYFSFAGHRMPLHITIDNQSSQALHLDWNKTAFIVNGYLLSVVNPDSHQDITSLYQDTWDGEMFIRVQVSSSSELPLKFIPPRTKYSFHTRSFPEFEPSEAQIQNMPELKDVTSHPKSSVLDPLIYSRLEDDYANVRVVLHLQHANQPAKTIPVDQTFFMTQQYKVDAYHNQYNVKRYPDRGYFIFDNSQESDGFAAAGIVTILAVLLILLVVAADAP
jgi:hypothetical protein